MQVDCSSSEKGQATQKVDVAGVLSEGSAVSTAHMSTFVPHALVAGSCPWLAGILSSDVAPASCCISLCEVQFHGSQWNLFQCKVLHTAEEVLGLDKKG